MLVAISGVVGFFGRLSFLVDENAHAVHFFVSALLQATGQVLTMKVQAWLLYVSL